MATQEQLEAVERAARRLIKEGLRLTPDGLIVRERPDKSDPHYELCSALEAISPLNPARHSLEPSAQAVQMFGSAGPGSPPARGFGGMAI